MVKIVDNYVLSEIIGKGQYGRVYKATHIDTKMAVAIKSIDIKKFQDISKLTECTKNQIDTLMTIQDNINIIKFVEMIKTSNNIYLVYQYCQGGTLDEEIKKFGKFPQNKALLYFKQLMNAFKSLAENKIFHRDIKPDNILIKSGHLKLADFGFCKKMASIEDLTQTVLGSPVYMAPEVLNGQMYNGRADVWSLGIVLFQMLFGYCPFGQGSMSDLMQHIRNFSLQIPKGSVSHCTQGLLLRMIEKDSFRRLSWEDLFYEYEVTQYGVLIRKDKGFQYDLMKLIKKNSNPQRAKQLKKTNSYKFNWDKITDRKSSVKSVQLDANQKITNLDQIIQMKKKIKDLSFQHTKCHQAAIIMSDIIRRKFTKQYHVIAYFICQTILVNIHNLMRKVLDFQAKNYKYLTANKSQLESIQKLLLVLSNQKQNLVPRLNKIKIELCSQNINNPEIMKFETCPTVRNKYLRNYISQIQKKHPTFQSFDRQELDKDITLHILKMLMALNMQNQKQLLIPNQHQEKLQLVKWLHLRKSDLNI